MLLRKPMPLWMSVSLFAVSVALMPLASQWLRRPVPPPHTPTELTALLSQATPSLYVIPVREGKPEGGIYICTRSQTPEQLMRLPRAREYAHRWQGVVYCEGIGKKSVIYESEIESWGEHGMRIGPLLFFGDPELLQRIREAILHH